MGVKKKGFLFRYRERIVFVGVLLSAVLMWELVVRVFSIEPFVLPDPLSVVNSAWQNLPDLWRHTAATAIEIVVGFVIAAIAGVTLAALMHYFSTLNQVLSPLLVTFQTVPK